MRGRNVWFFLIGFNGTIEVLSNISSTTQTLITSGNELLGSVNTIAMSIDDIVSECEAAIGTSDPQCRQISSARFTTGANFSMVCEGQA